MSTIQSVSLQPAQRIIARPVTPVVQDNTQGEEPTQAARGPIRRTVQLGRPEAPTVSPAPQPAPDPEAASPISANPPESADTDSFDVRVKKALDQAFEKFNQGGGGNEADLARALFFSVLGIVSETGGANSYVQSATLVSGYMDELHAAGGDSPAGPTQSVQAAADASIAQAGFDADSDEDTTNINNQNPLNIIA